MQVSKKHVALVLAVGLCLLPTMVAAERPGKPTRKHRPATTAPVPQMVIPAGPHYLATWVGTTAAQIELPADFFFNGSDPVDQSVPMEGDAIAPVPVRRDGFKMKFARLVEPGEDVVDRGVRPGTPYDTVMVQHEDAVLNGIGSRARVDLTMEDVRLRSAAPMEVTGTETRYYDVFLEVTAQHPDGGEVKTGYMTYTRNGEATGEFTAEVFAWARYIFIPQDGGKPIIHDVDEQMTISTPTPTPFLIPALNQGRAGGAEVDEAWCCNMCCASAGGDESSCHCGSPP